MAGMVAILPTSTPADTAGAFAIIALLGSESAAKTRLQELVAEKQAALSLLDEAKAVAAKTASDRAQADMAVVQAAQLLATAQAKEDAAKIAADSMAQREASLGANSRAEQAALAVRGQELDKRLADGRAALDQRARELDMLGANLKAVADARQAELDARENEVRAQEANAKLAQGINVDTARALKAKQEDLEGRLSKLRSIVNA